MGRARRSPKQVVQIGITRCRGASFQASLYRGEMPIDADFPDITVRDYMVVE
jgi:hypothetical protein